MSTWYSATPRVLQRLLGRGAVLTVLLSTVPRGIAQVVRLNDLVPEMLNEVVENGSLVIGLLTVGRSPPPQRRTNGAALRAYVAAKVLGRLCRAGFADLPTADPDRWRDETSAGRRLMTGRHRQ